MGRKSSVQKRNLTADPQQQGAKCSACPFAVKGQAVRPVWGEGPYEPDGIIVGEYPSAEDAAVGRPFTGGTGLAFHAVLTKAKLDRDTLYLAHAILCQPPPNKTEPMLRKAAVCCRPALLSQLSKFPTTTPTLAMGKWAAFGLTLRDRGMMGSRGFIRSDFRLPRNEEPICDTGIATSAKGSNKRREKGRVSLTSTESSD